MKILHITPAFYPATYWGGPIYSVYGLCNALARLPDLSLKVLTTDSAGPRRKDSVNVTNYPMHYSNGYDVYFCRRWWAASVSPALILRLWSMIRWADIVHLTAVYSFPTIPTLLICRLLGKPVVWSPRGALQRWEGSTRTLLKRIWGSICNSLIKSEKCILHVTSEEEATESLRQIPKGIASIIPNGVEIPENLPDKFWLPEGKLRLIFIGRIHPKKGIENLIQALKLLKNISYNMAIYGSGDEAYSLDLRRLVRDLNLANRISFCGHVDGEYKTEAFKQADVCVVPSYTENFGMVVVEALAHGVPVIASKGTPWNDLEKYGCGLWVDNSPTSLARAMREVIGRDLKDMGEKGQIWMRAKFSWENIAIQMCANYKKLAAKNYIND